MSDRRDPRDPNSSNYRSGYDANGSRVNRTNAGSGVNRTNRNTNGARPQGQRTTSQRDPYAGQGRPQRDPYVQQRPQGEAYRQQRDPYAAQGRTQGNPNGQRHAQSRNSYPEDTYTMNERTNRSSNHHKGGRPSSKKKGGKKKSKIILFVVEIMVLVLLLGALWFVTKGEKVNYVSINEDNIVIDEQVKAQTETGAMQGYWNIALFGVDSREGQLDKNTRTDTIMIASINQDTKEVKLVSVFRDTYLNLSTDQYNKANSAYAKGGPEQAINMLNMNLDMNITDFVTIGFSGLIDAIDAVGGVEIDVKESEIDHLNNYQISMVGKADGTNAAGETSFTATAGKDYTPVTSAGLQTLNGLQATAYCRIRYVGNDFERAQRQRTVLTAVAEKAKTMSPATLGKIAESVFGETATSLQLDQIVTLLGDVASYNIGENDGFPFEENRSTGNIGKKGSCVVPVDLTDNVIKLHSFLFDENDYTPSDTVKQCSEKIASDTGSYVN